MPSKEVKFGFYVWISFAAFGYAIDGPPLWTAVFVIVAMIYKVAAEVLQGLGR